jgi:hypothetical protein|tara:strand:- start:97 stop:291 length:195 start_codon:yes stop_codon:yes gene_type:complete
MKFIVVLMILVFVGCASERPSRTSAQILSPDKLKMMIAVNPDISHPERNNTEVHQLRLGLDWNL